MDEARSVSDVETPRQEGNAGVVVFMVHSVVVDEPKLVANGRREALHFLGLRV